MLNRVLNVLLSEAGVEAGRVSVGGVVEVSPDSGKLCLEGVGVCVPGASATSDVTDDIVCDDGVDVEAVGVDAFERGGVSVGSCDGVSLGVVQVGWRGVVRRGHCVRHPAVEYKYYCAAPDCGLALCAECDVGDHSGENHDLVVLSEAQGGMRSALDAAAVRMQSAQVKLTENPLCGATGSAFLGPPTMCCETRVMVGACCPFLVLSRTFRTIV